MSFLNGAQQKFLLSSGEQLIGEVLPESDKQTLFIRSKTLGDLKLLRSLVVSIQAIELKGEKLIALPIEANEPTSKQTVELKLSADRQDQSQGDLLPNQNDSTHTAEDHHMWHKCKVVLRQIRSVKTPDYWNGMLRLGLNYSTGDKKWSENYMRGQLEIRQKGSPNFYRYSGSFSFRQNARSSGEKYISTDRYDVNMIYRRTIAKDWFIQNSLGYRSDGVKGIKREVKETLGLGYKYKLSPTIELVLGGGVGVEDFQTESSEDQDGLSGDLNIFQELKWRPNKRTTFSQKFNYYSDMEDPNQYSYVLTGAFRVRLTDLFGLEFSYDQNYDGNLGSGLLKDDIRWRNALVVYF
ncbi:MAG: DUF481 domain-containing protein [Verrucomicrobiota bacterium]|nr:DUF481 domain-containing protein [Verrucomicrobiota bacterium]MEC8650207.1 DUF481 domain-containing protein [Verrucomicrobiota bacterium]